MKILFIAPLPPPITGQSLACSVLIENMKLNGHDVTIINLSKTSLSSGEISWKRVKEVLAFFKAIRKSCSKKELIYLNTSQSFLGNIKDIIIFLLLFKQLNKTYIHMHGGAGMFGFFKKKLNPLRYVNKFFIKKMAGVIVLGRRLTKIYEGMIDSKKIFIAPNFSMPEYYISVRHLKSIREKPLNILFLSNLLTGKGYEDLLAAYKLLPSFMQEKISLNFAGAFKDSLASEVFLDDIKTLCNVHYHGIVSGAAKVNLLYNAHVFCLPTYYPYEGQPISILEAYASGCLVLTTNHSGIFDVFTPGVNGFEVQPQNPQSISYAIETIYNNRSILHKYSLINLYHAKRYYTVSKHLETMNSILFSNNINEIS